MLDKGSLDDLARGLSDNLLKFRAKDCIRSRTCCIRGGFVAKSRDRSRCGHGHEVELVVSCGYSDHYIDKLVGGGVLVSAHSPSRGRVSDCHCDAWSLSLRNRTLIQDGDASVHRSCKNLAVGNL